MHQLNLPHLFQASGTYRDLDQEFLVNLIRGRVYLQISSDDNPRGELRGQIKLEPGQCKLPQATHIEAEGSCTSEGKTYFDGEAWFPDYDKKCTTCSCKVSAHVQIMLKNTFLEMCV